MYFTAISASKQISTIDDANLPQLDLTSVRRRVAKENSELTAEELDEMELRYIKFLIECKNDPNEKHEPDKDVDKYWHAHILDTMRYAEDCQRYFGFFLHHIPTMSSNGSDCETGCGAVPSKSEQLALVSSDENRH